MKRYIALLRGINVGGKNKISMAELKQGFAKLGFVDTATYLNSGNVIFSSTNENEHDLSDRITNMIKEGFELNIPVFIILQETLAKRLTHAPKWWGDDNKEIYDNLIFLLPPLTYESFYDEIGHPKEEYESVHNYEKVVFWSFSRKDYQKSNWWSKTAGSNVKDKITIRTANTIRKIVGM